MSLALIGGTGFEQLPDLQAIAQHDVETPYGRPSAPIQEGLWHGQRLLFLSRHGDQHTLPPHQINYRANIAALADLGARRIWSVACVGAVDPSLEPATLVLPVDLIDYTWGRQHSFFQDGAAVEHCDFTHPYDLSWHAECCRLAKQQQLRHCPDGVYAATQGPRLETAAEIRRLQRDGATIVGMTGMPEASLAAERGLAYLCTAVVANKAAGLSDEALSMAMIGANMQRGLAQVQSLLLAWLENTAKA